MILQLNPPLPLYSIPHQEECYAHLVLEYGIEDYVYFVVALEKTGEMWVLSNTQVRASKNFTAGRPIINKEQYSAYLKHGSPTIVPLKEQLTEKEDIKT